MINAEQVEEFEELKLRTDEAKLIEFLDTNIWLDIKDIFTLYLNWEMAQLVEDQPIDVIRTQGRCMVLRELGYQIESQIKERAQTKNSVGHNDREL